MHEHLHSNPVEPGSPSPLQTVLFDIGNVIASDYWEALWLKRGTGLADVLSVPVRTAASIGRKLWREFSLREADEASYWSEFEALLGIRIPKSHVEKAERININANPLARQAIDRLAATGVAVGLISNNTSFWAPRQLALAGVADRVEQRLSFLSCTFGADKTESSPDLFSIAAATVDANQTLVIDDRPINAARARTMGFSAALYGHGVNEDGDGYYIQNDFNRINILEVLWRSSC